MITVSEHGLDAVRRELHAMQERARDLTPAWEEFLWWFAEQNFEQFTSRGRRFRTEWAPLAPRTKAEKARKGYLQDPLIRTTELMRSMTRRPFAVEHVTASGLTAGTNVKYAKWHQRGTRYMPSRPLVNARAVAREGVAGSLVASWIVHGRPNIGGVRLER